MTKKIGIFSECYTIKEKYIWEQRSIEPRSINISEYARRPFLQMNDAEKKIADLINSSEPFLVGRIGETELRTIHEYHSGRWLKKSCRIASHCICNNAGFFPNNPFAISKFCKIYFDSMLDIDYLALFAWPHEEEYMEYSVQLKGCFLSKVVDILQCEYKWTSALKGKKILIVSPFEKSIQSQYRNKNNLWGKENDILPECKLLTLKSVQSIGGNGAEGFRNWFEALKFMEQKIDNLDFDIALLGCGAYGIPLGSYIKNLGKQAIVMGGCLQLMFGIMGKRWENDLLVKKYINQYWVRPSEDERPRSLEKVEEGCYW